MFMSSAHDSILIWGGGVRMSDVYMLKRAGDNTPPCGTRFSVVFVLICGHYTECRHSCLSSNWQQIFCMI